MNPSRLADQILEYLLHHPDAQDTVEGIAEWWMLEQQVRHTVAEVQRALDNLETQGFLLSARSGGRREPARYRLNPARAREIRAHCSARRTHATSPDHPPEEGEG